MFKGSLVAMITPFTKNNKVDEKGIEELVEFQIKNGTNGIVPCGTTGESPTLSHEEHKKVVELTIKAVAGRVPVIAGTGSNCTQEALDLTSYAKEAGADAALIITPFYNKPTQKGLYLHFKKIAEEVDLPIIIYNVPSRTGVNMLPETLAELAELKNIIGVKEASGNLDQMTEIVELCGDKITLLSGDDKLLLPVLSIGGKGVISVVANIIPYEVSNMIKEFENGNYFQTAILDGVPGDPENPNGTHILFNKEDGLLLTAEFGIVNSKDEQLNSKIAFGVWTYTSKFEKNDFNDFGENVISLEKNYGFYLTAEKLLAADFENPSKSLSAFLRIGYANKNINPVDFYFGAGFKLTSLFRGRDEDELGVALALSHNSLVFRNTVAMSEDMIIKSYEINLEATYSLKLTPWLKIQPDIQYIIDPSYCTQSGSAFIMGSRMELTF